VVDSTHMSGRALHETNVIGTMNLLAAAGASDTSVRHLIVKSSSLVYGSSMQDPAWFRESMSRTAPPTGRVERSLVEVESYLRDFAVDNPHITVTLLRFANVLGTDIVTPISKALDMGVAPGILGFDPLVQFVEESDVVRSLHFVFDRQLQGVYNVAGDGRIPWSEVASLGGVTLVPFLPPFMTGVTASALSTAGIMDLPPELLDLLRFGRGIDNRKLKAAGFRYQFTSAGTIESFAEARRLRRAVGGGRPAYTYERDVENFFRRSAAVIRRPVQT
jgi:UDP-glucose 4-epimerase